MDRLQRNLLPVDGGRATIERSPVGLARPKGVICSLATGRHRELLAETAPSMAAYAQHHGWDLVLSSEHLSDRPPSWSKLVLVQELTQRYEYVWWIDADAIIVALDRDILAEVGGEADIWFARHPQDRDPDATVLNAGVFLARSGAFTRDLFQSMWDQEQFIEHNWWENAALLDLLGYSLEAPFSKLRETDWDGRIGTLDLAWNNVPGYCESPTPAVNHHARSDHDDFGLRQRAMSNDREGVMVAYPTLFEHLRSPSSAGVDGGPRRTHEFDGIDVGVAPTVDELLGLLDRLDADFEAQRLKLLQVLDRYEDTVNEMVRIERTCAAAGERARANEHALSEVSRLHAHIAALENTKLMRAVRPLRGAYGKALGRFHG
jgi:hypothetical protein